MSQAEPSSPPRLGLQPGAPSAASLASTASMNLDLPLSPVVVAPTNNNGNNGGSPEVPMQEAAGEAAGAGAAGSPAGLPPTGADPGDGSNQPQLHLQQPHAADGQPLGAAAAMLRSANTHSSRQFLLQAVRRPGTEVWAWGRGDCGQLGSGSTEDSHQPCIVEGLKQRDVVNLAAGTLHTAAVTGDGELYVFGSNDSAQLGMRQRGADDAVTQPTRVDALENFQVRQVACGASHTLALLDDDGGMAAFGSNEHGQTGLGPTGSTQVALPRVVKELRRMHIVRAAAGGSHSIALSSTGGVFSFGSGNFGALGRGTTEGTDVPRPISRLWPLGIVQVACGENHSAALTVDGRLLTWGRGKYGALGLGDFENRSTPQLVRALAGLRGTQVSCGDDHTALLADDGSVHTWGRATWGQTGQGHTDNTCLPRPVAGLAGHRIVQVAAGGRHTLALSSTNQLWGFGCNDSGQLGTPACSSQPSPQRIQGLPDCPVLFVVAGGDHSVAVMDRGARAGTTPGPCAGRVHGEQWCAVSHPDLLQLTAEAGDHKGDAGRLQAVIDAVESVFSSPGYLLAALAKRQGAHTAQLAQGAEQGQRQQQQQQVQEQGGTEGGAGGGEAEPMDVSPTGRHPEAGASAAAAPAPQVGQSQTAAQPAGQQQQQSSQQQPSQQHSSQQQSSQQQSSQQQPSQQQSSQQQQQSLQQQREEAKEAAGDGLDLGRIGATYQSLLKLYEPQVVSALGSTCVRLLDMLEKYLNSLHQQQSDAGGMRQGLGWLAPLLFVLLQNPLNSEVGSFGGKLLMRISRIVAVTLPAEERLAVRQALQALLSRLPPDVFAARCVRPVQRYITSCVQSGLGATRVQVMMAGVLVDVLRQANEDGGGIIAYTEFNSRSLSEHANLQAEYQAWVQNKDSTALCSICQMPYLLTPEAKSRIMHGEAAMQQQQHLSAAAMQALFQGVPPAAAAFLHIQVRRSHVVEDALNQLVHRADDLKKPLRVTFISGGVPEPAQDEGGVTKELFQLLTRDLFKPEYAMFTYSELTRTYWFNPSSLEAEIEYALVGAVLGLAIYNGVILDVHFPMALWKKLLGHKLGLQDLKAAFPDLGRGLQQLLDFDGDVEAVFCRTFTAEYEYYGERRSQELKPGGADIPVTADNRAEYVHLYSEWVLDRSVDKQFTAFRRGFLRVCSGPALTMFTPAELELLVCGLPHLDFEALQAVAKYEGGYHKDHPEVRWFWEVLQSLSLEQKRAFLQFTTGSDRAPVGGLGKLPLLIQRAGPDTDRLPTSHTCFNALLVPEYSSKAKLRERLLTAVENAQGFGLQ